VREEKIKFQVAESFASDMFRKVTSLPMQRQSDHHSGETIDKINKAMYAIREFSGSNFMYLNTIIFSIGSVFSLTVLRWKAGVIMLAFAVITFIVVRKFDQLIIPLIKAKNRKEHVVMSTLFDFLSNIKTVITLRFESRALTALRGKIADVFPVFRKYSILNEWKRFSMDMLMKLVITLVLGWYVWEQFQLTGTVLIGTFTMLFQYAQKMNDAFGSFTWQYSGIVTKKADMEAVADIEDAYAALTSDYQVTLANRQHIQLRDLLFTYADTDEQEQTLQGIHIDLAPGKKIALVGESGSGKSTLLSLLR
jgi:ABC-type bacteriocin/lantibiotic exporter with double-glycine peptidase domain